MVDFTVERHHGSSHKDSYTPEEIHFSGLGCVLSLLRLHGQPREKQETGIMPIHPEVHVIIFLISLFILIEDNYNIVMVFTIHQHDQP